MQETEQKPKKPKFSDLRKIPGITHRALFRPEESNELSNFFRAAGHSEDLISKVKQGIAAFRKARRDDKAYHRIDQYLVAGAGAIDLVLLAAILAIGKLDSLLNVALLLLIISLILAAGSLFFSFVKQGYGIAHYGTIHRNVASFSLYTGIASMTLLIWRISPVDGIVFLFLTIVMFFACITFFLLAAIVNNVEPSEQFYCGNWQQYHDLYPEVKIDVPELENGIEREE